MAMLMDCNVVVLHLKNAKKNHRMNICTENFEMIQNGGIIIDKQFERIYYFPRSFSNHEVQAHMTSNSYKIFPSVRKCLCSLNRQRRNVVLVDTKRVYVTDKTDSLVQIFQDLSNKYETIFDIENDAVTNSLKGKTKSTNEVKDVISLKRMRKEIDVLPPQRKMKAELKSKTYCPNLEIMFAISSRPIFRTNNRNPASLMEVVSSSIDPYGAPSSLGEIVADCAGPGSIAVPTAPRPSHQPHSRDYAVHNSTVSNDHPTHIGLMEEASSSGSIPPSVHGAQEQSGNRQLSPKYPRYSTYDARKASYPAVREFRNIDTNEMARTGLFYTGNADEVQCFQCGLEQRNWRPDKDPLLEHIKESPDCQFLETLLGVNTLNQYKAQIRLSGKISGREYFSSSSIDGRATGGNSFPHFTASDHIRSPQYQAYTVRLSTFTKWPPSMTQRPEEVAHAGFYYTVSIDAYMKSMLLDLAVEENSRKYFPMMNTDLLANYRPFRTHGLQDVVRCFACDGGLKNWDPEDNPWIEHARWFAQCPFVQKVKGQEFIDNVRRMTEESDEEEDVVVHSNFQRNCPMANQPDSQHLSVGNDTDEPSQLDTDAAQSAIQTGYSRSAVALAIDILISNGKSDYSAEDIMGVILEKEDRGELLPTDSDSELPRNSSQSLRFISSANQDTEAILRENKSLKTIVTCIKCKTQARNILFLPCSHHCLCQMCADKCSLCPMCYKIIKQKIKSFMG